jgi:hypothetical protein
VNVETMDKPVSTPAPPHRWVALLMAVALLVGGATLIQAGGSVLRGLGVVAVHQQYVALSLPDPAGLPAQAAPGTTITFDFAISNATTAIIHQRWVVDVSGPGLAVEEMAHGSATVNPGMIVTTQVNAQMPATRSKVTMKVRALGRPLAPLEFHVDPAPGGGAP